MLKWIHAESSCFSHPQFCSAESTVCPPARIGLTVKLKALLHQIPHCGLRELVRFFFTSGDAMCAVCTGHLLLMVETPHSQKPETRKTPGQQNAKTTKQKPKPKHKQTRENSGASSLYIIGGYLLPGPGIQIQAAVDLHAKRHCAKGL